MTREELPNTPFGLVLAREVLRRVSELALYRMTSARSKELMEADLATLVAACDDALPVAVDEAVARLFSFAELLRYTDDLVAGKLSTIDVESEAEGDDDGDE